MMTPLNPHAVVEFGDWKFSTWRDKSLVSEVGIELTTNQASEATVRLYDPHFEILDRYATADDVPSVGVRIWMGFGDELGEPVFKGLLARIERGAAATTFRAYDMSFRMMRTKRTEYHKGSDLDVLAKLAQRNDLRFEPPDGNVQLEKHDSLTQDEQNDWEHAMERAREAGLVLFVRGDTLFAKEPAKFGTPKMTLAFRKDFVLHQDFSLTYKLPENSGGRPRTVETRGRGRRGRRLSGESTAGGRGVVQVEIKRDLAISSRSHARRRAHAKKELDREHAFTISLRTVPTLNTTRADVRDTIRLQEVGRLFSGDYLVDRVSHNLSAQGFTSAYELYRDAKGLA